jgi:hypothetical protein
MLGLKSCSTAGVVIVASSWQRRSRKGQFKLGKLGGPTVRYPNCTVSKWRRLNQRHLKSNDRTDRLRFLLNLHQSPEEKLMAPHVEEPTRCSDIDTHGRGELSAKTQLIARRERQTERISHFFCVLQPIPFGYYRAAPSSGSKCGVLPCFR